MSLTNQAITNFNDGNKLYKVNLFNEALEQYKKAVDNDPTFYNAHFCLAKTCLRLKKYDDGVNYFKKFIDLIPEEKQGEYLIAFANILIDEHQSGRALSTIGALNINFNDQQILNYAQLLLSNNKVSKAVHHIFQIKPSNFTAKDYEQLISNDTFSESTIYDFCNEDIIPRFFSSQKRLTLLKKAEIRNEYLEDILQNADRLVEIIRTHENIDYDSKISELEEEIINAQNIVLQHAQYLLKTNKIDLSKRVLSTLESTKFDTNKTQEFSYKIKALEKKNANTRLKKVAISSVVIMLLGLSSYFGYHFYQKTEAFNSAMASKSLNKYNYYLNTFGDHEDIHRLREEKLYQIALKSSTSEDINALVSLYPNSEMLQTLTFNNIYKNIDLNFFGVNSSGTKLVNISNSNAYTYKVPFGCKVGYKIDQENKIPVEKYLSVNQNLNINEELLDSETLLLNETYNNNEYKWNLYTKNNKSKFANNPIKEEIALKNGSLNLVSQKGSKSLVYSLIDGVDLNNNFDFRITTSINTTKYSSNGTYLMFGASNRAFLYFGYIGTASNGSFVIGHNDWDDSYNNWKNWTKGWERVNNLGYNAELKVEKKDGRLNYYINNVLLKDYPAKNFYGSKFGFGINAGTKSSVSFLKIERLNKSKQIDFKENKTYFCWVDELNVRDSSLDGNIITTIKIGEPVRFLGEVGAKVVNATFREQSKPDYYYKVELENGIIGWVHGGALCEIKAVNSKINPDVESPKEKTIDTTIAIDSLEILEVTDDKQNFFIIGENDHVESNTYQSIDAFLNKTNNDISHEQLADINGDLNQKIGDTIYLTEEAFNKSKKAESKTKVSIDEVIPFEFVENPPVFGNCSGKSNSSLKKCFAQNLTKHLYKNANVKHYQTLGLSDGDKEVKYSFTITKNGTPTNIKVWADHHKIENDIQSIIANINDFNPGKHEGNSVGVVYNSTFNFRIGEKPKQPKLLKTVVEKEKEEEKEEEKEIVILPRPSNFTFYNVDRAPVFPGCEGTDEPIMFACSKEKINAYILENINYKELAVVEEKAYNAKVSISFKIGTSGNVKNSIVICDSDIDYALKTLIVKEVKIVVDSLPKMQPALLSGESVEVNYKVGLNLKI